MKIRATKSFTGALSMTVGQVVECSDNTVINDLLQAGYVEEAETVPKRSVKKGETKSNKIK